MKKIYLLILLFAVHFLKAQVNTAAFTEKENIHELEKKGHQKLFSALTQTVSSNNFNVNFYRCEWTIDPAIRYITGVVTSYFTITSASNFIIFDISKALTVDSVRYKGKNISFAQTPDNGLQINFPQTLALQQQDSITVFYQGVPPTGGGFGSFVQKTHAGTPIIWTLSEPYGAKDWWPCKNGLTDKADSLDVIINNPAANNATSNGLLTAEWIGTNGNKYSYWKHRYPIASYLVALAVTNYTIDYDTARLTTSKMPMIMYSYPENRAYFKNATDIAKLALELFSSLLGDYPFSKEHYSQTQYTSGGGMEHQSNSFIGHAGTRLVTHELGHQWFGDRITCASWEDLWLNEGFATYTEFLWVEKYEPHILLNHLDYIRKKAIAKPDGSVKVSDTNNINRLFDGRLTYIKGSCLVHMLRWKLGDSLFFKGIKQYLNDPLLKYGFARTTDLQKNLEQVSGQSLTQFFKDWYHGEGFPHYQVEWSENANKWIKIKLHQTTTHSSVPFFAMPVPIQLKNTTHDTTLVLNHTYSGQEFWVNPGFIPDTAIFDPKIWLLSDSNVVVKKPMLPNINDVKIFPNPVVDKAYVTITNPINKGVLLQLYNSIGQIFYKKEVSFDGRDEKIEIPFSQLPKGVYWLRLHNENVNIIKKIIR